ncbi:hypothetical protein ACTNDS_09080 [Blautia sp. HCP3S3_C12]|uniref:hypothetical protein n=1 Tax=unclassified Blautia TaxID=2648079 RepID=UPI003F8B3369
MTKIKNTKKGMAKKTLSMSLVVAMLATSNVPVWAAEFSDGTDAAVTSEAEAPVADTADAFTDDAETEAPVADTTADAEAATAVSESKTDIKLSQTGWTNPVEANGEFYDKDGDVVDEFYYTWYVDGLAQTPQPVYTDDGTITAYQPTAADLGRKVTLRIYSDKYDNGWTPTLGNDSWVYESDPVTVTAVDLNREQAAGRASLIYLGAPGHMVTYNGKDQSPDSKQIVAEFTGADGTKLDNSEFDITSTLKAGDNGTDADSVFTITATPKNTKLYSGSLNYDYKIQVKEATKGEFKASMAKPNTTYEYTGNVITPAISDVKATALSTAVIKSVEADSKDAKNFTVDNKTHKAKVTLDSAPNYVTKSVRDQGKLTTSDGYKVVKRNLANVNIQISSIPYDGTVLTFNDKRFNGNIHFYDKTTGEELNLVMGVDYDVQVLDAPKAGTKTYDLEITAVDTKTKREYKNTTGFQKMSYTLGNETFAHEGYKLTDDAKTYLTTAATYTGKERVIDKSKVVFTKKEGGKTVALSPENYEVVVQGVDAGKKAGTVIIKGLKSYEHCEEIYHFDINAVKATAKTAEKVSYVKGYTKASQYAPKTTVTAKVDGKDVTLEEGKDYTISYKFNTTNMIDGIIITTVQITNKNYKGTESEDSVFENITRISKRDLSKCTVTVEPKSYTYTGAVVKPTLKVMDGEEPLTEGVDYEIVGYKNAKDVGTATVILQGIGDNANPADGIYDSTTTLSATYEITAANAADIKVEFAGGNTGTVYTGNVIKPTIYKVTLNGNDVSKQFDFVYPNTNVNVGTGHVILKPVAGNKNFTGQKDAEFKITPRALEGELKVYDENGTPYTVGRNDILYEYKNGEKKKVYFAVDGKPHTFAKAVFTPTGDYAKYVTENDYEIVYVDNTYGKSEETYEDSELGRGIAHIAVVGKGNFTGTQKVTDSTDAVYYTVEGADYKFYIKKYEIMKQHVTIADGEYAAGQPVRPNVTVTVGGKTLVENQDYKLTYSAISDLTNGKTMKVTVHGINGYKGEITGTWGVVKKDMANAQVVLDKAQYKKDEKPAVTVYNAGVKVADTEYTVSYADDTVTVTANKDSKYYTGSQTVKVVREDETGKTIGTPVITNISITGNKATVVLGGESANATGYDYVISADRDCITNKNYGAVTKNQVKTTGSFEYVQQGTYYAYCHAWKRGADGKKVFGEWSNAFPFVVSAITPSQPVITSVKAKGSTVTVTYTQASDAKGYDVVLGTAAKKVNGEIRPVNYGTLVKKNVKGNVVKVTFKNVEKGTYYAGLHAFNRTSDDGKKVFSRWSNVKAVRVK